MPCELPPGARSICPIANILDILGDRWTLLVVRDLLFLGKRRFGELLASPESIPTNILTDRLRRLEESGIVVKVPYQTRPQRFEYHPTAKGTDLLPILKAMIDWGQRHIPGTPESPPRAV
jgi:DNA-binding HxlR family transcriptional regulator